ncbi:MAG: S41 family peptidase [Bacilli bacterium]|nr:S41 family peptidase [Bacilli bacterium]
MKKIKLNFIQIVLLITVPTIIMSIISGSLIYSRLNYAGKVSHTNNKYVNEFINTYNRLLDDYYEDLDENELVDAAISGMLTYAGDDYTIYMNEDATEALNEKLEGIYEGVGIRITSNEKGEIYIFEIFEDSPAKEAGLMVNDIIVSINGEDVFNKGIEEASKIIKNSKDKNINMCIKRDDVEQCFDITRKTLIVPAINSSIKEVNGKKIGYINIKTFSSTVDTQVEATLSSMENDGIDSLIIDVRGNTGGYLTNCTNIIEMFLEKDKLMYSIKSKKESIDYRDSTENKKNYPVVVLINGGSASASEILAASLKYSYGATIVGVKSYGKGKVQTTGELEDGTMIKYTSALWYTPNGDSIDEVGLVPDIEVKLSETFIDNPTEENDNQLNEAIRILTSE